MALGIETVGMERDRATLRIPYKPELVGDPDTGVIAGGVVTTLLDHACGQAVWATTEVEVSIATLDLRIDYMRPAAPRAGVTAAAHCYKVTRTIAFVRAEAWDVDSSDLIATAPRRLAAVRVWWSPRQVTVVNLVREPRRRARPRRRGGHHVRRAVVAADILVSGGSWDASRRVDADTRGWRGQEL